MSGRWSRRFRLAGSTLLAAGLAGGMWGWAAGSAGAAEADVVQSRVTYPAGGGRLLWMEEYRPRHQAGPVPAVLVIHGGGWSGGGPAGFSGPAMALARDGLAAFDVDYRLDTATRAGYPDQVEELADAARWIESRAAGLGVRPGRLGALGSSAGGNLAALLALDPSAPALDAVVTWSGPMSLTGMAPMVEAGCRPGGAGGAGGAGVSCGAHWLAHDLVEYLGCLPQDCPARWAAGSPVDRVRAGALRRGTAWLIFNSRDEIIPLSGATRMVAELTHAGADVRLVVVPGDRHAGEYQDVALGPSLDFLVDHLR